ncbi:MAG TPA: hypothetical protein VGI95_00450 [Caulobacteraceae bacterium]|jgi:hypothetical protein
MRRAAHLALAAALTLVPAASIAGPSSTDSTKAASHDNDRLLTPEQEGRQGVMKGVMAQPFRDFNMIRSKIPSVLIEALADPYDRPSPGTCEGIQFQVQRLDYALGPDLDQPISTEHPGLVTRGEGLAKTASLDAMRSELQDNIPFDGFIRTLSGADRHDHLVIASIQAGAIRRGYLKGLGEAHACMPPGVPRHLAHPVSVATVDSAKR